MPWAADDLAAARVAIASGLARLDEPAQAAVKQAAALMRAAIGERKKLAPDIEDDDRAALDVDEFSRPGREFAQGSDDVLRHANGLRCRFRKAAIRGQCVVAANFAVAAPLGTALGGPLTTWLGAQHTLLVSAAATIASGLAATAILRVRLTCAQRSHVPR